MLDWSIKGCGLDGLAVLCVECWTGVDKRLWVLDLVELGFIKTDFGLGGSS